MQVTGSLSRVLNPGLDCTLGIPSLLRPGPGNAEIPILFASLLSYSLFPLTKDLEGSIGKSDMVFAFKELVDWHR